MRDFVDTSFPRRIVFGPGTVNRLAEEATALGSRKPMVLVSQRDQDLADTAASALGGLQATAWRQVAQHVPVEVAEAATTEAVARGADLIVTLGGGSTTGLGKAVARRTRLPVLAVPTTYAGSEMTPIWGETSDARKVTGRDPVVLPRTVIYDAELTLSLPVQVSGASAMNALAHCVEAVYTPASSPLTTLVAVEAARSLLSALPRLATDNHDLDVRSDVLYGAYLSGGVLAAAGISVHHHVCHVLGGMYDLPHAELHSVVLPHAVAEVQGMDPRALAPLSDALSVGDVPGLLAHTSRSLGLPQSLSDLGLTAAQAMEAVPELVKSTSGDPTPLSVATATRLVMNALRGDERGAA